MLFSAEVYLNILFYKIKKNIFKFYIYILVKGNLLY